MKETKEKELLQWHPAFYATAQIEFQEEAEYLEFENEHQLGTKPMAIDVLVIKNERNYPVKKNIGRIFRKHNIIEYKSPTDYVSINTFYKVYGYTCFYKADTVEADGISIEDVTITFFGSRYPRTLMKHLQEVRGYKVKKQEDGIYYVQGDRIPIQILVGNQLSPEENLWLWGLANELKSHEMVERFVGDYQKHKDNGLYQSVMNIIVQANEKQFKEEQSMMCQALMDLFGDELMTRARNEVREQVEKEVKEQTEKEVREKMEKEISVMKEKTIEKGVQQGERRINDLILRLSEQGRAEEIVKAASDAEYQKKLLKEFGV